MSAPMHRRRWRKGLSPRQSYAVQACSSWTLSPDFFIDRAFVPGGRLANETCEKTYLAGRSIAAAKMTCRAARLNSDDGDSIENSAVADLPHLRRAGGTCGIGYAGSTAAVAHHGVETIALLLEARHQRAVERAATRQLDAHRIDEAAVDQNFVMDL